MANGVCGLPRTYWQSVASKTTLTSSYVQKSVTTGRKLSDYEVLVFECWRNNWIVGTITVMRTDFTGNDGISAVMYWGSESIEYDVKYVDDTTITMKKNSTSTATIALKVCGLGLN